MSRFQRLWSILHEPLPAALAYPSGAAASGLGLSFLSRFQRLWSVSLLRFVGGLRRSCFDLRRGFVPCPFSVVTLLVTLLLAPSLRFARLRPSFRLPRQWCGAGDFQRLGFLPPEPTASRGLRRQIKGIYTKCLLKSGARSHQILLNLSACLTKPPLPSLKIQYGLV